MTKIFFFFESFISINRLLSLSDLYSHSDYIADPHCEVIFHNLLLIYLYIDFYIHVCFCCILISGGNELPTAWLPFLKVHSCCRWKSNFHYIHSATEILNARKEIFTGIRESRIHHDSV